MNDGCPDLNSVTLDAQTVLTEASGCKFGKEYYLEITVMIIFLYTVVCSLFLICFIQLGMIK